MPKANTNSKGSKTTKKEEVDIQTTENLAEEAKTAALTKATGTKLANAKMVTTKFIRPRGIKDKYIVGQINGKDFKVPYNKTVEIPEPVEKIIMWSLAAQDFADEYIEREKNDPDDE